MTVDEIQSTHTPVIDLQDNIIDSKLFGSFVNKSINSNSLLYKTCFLYHRLHYNTVIESLNIERLKIIKQDATKLFNQIGNKQNTLLCSCILKNVIGTVNIILNPEDNITLLENYTTVKNESLGCSSEFTTLLALENIYYTNTLTNLINDSNFTIPSPKNGMSLYYLDSICKKIDKFEDINSKFLKFYCQIKFGDLQDKEVINFLNILIKDISFPNANEINGNKQQVALDLYLQIILNYYNNFSKENIRNWEELITSIITKSFQNISIAGIAAKLYNQLGELHKSELFFDNYIIYNNKYFEFNKKFQDIVSILNLANILEDKNNISIFLNMIYQEYQLDVILKKDGSLILESNKFDSIKIPKDLNDILVKKYQLDVILKKDGSLILESNKFGSIKIPKDLNDILVKSWIILYTKSDINKNIDDSFYFALDLYLQIILNYYNNFSKENIRNWEELITSIITKSFQNISIAGIAAKLYNQLGELHKSELFFDNYIIYNNKYFEFNKKFQDIVSILNLANILEDKNNISIFLNMIYQEYQLDVILKKDGSLILESNKFDSIKIPKDLNDILVKSWIILYTKSDINKNIDDSFYCLANILQLNLDKDTKLKYEFEYSYNLSLVKQNEKSCNWLKERILTNNPEDNIKSWLLLAIVESSKEEKINSLTIANSLLNPLEEHEDDPEHVHDPVDISNLSFEDRYHYIVFKFLQLDIVTEMHGSKDSIDLLASLFELYDLLFAKFENTKRVHESPRYTKEYVLQLVWLQASKMYLLNDQISDALGCLKEISSMSVDFKNLNCLNMKGYINKDISQFETVLGYDPTNLIALNGMANLLLNQDNADNKSLEYINKLNNMSLKITTAVNNNIQCQFNGQLQFNLYKLYVKLGHSKDLQKSLLLTTIGNLENDTILDPWIVKLI
ncbi:hypothetical protein HANVADRAFT_2225 [Hanseniaspora valbyensis NRRL Y-1626]|uniref:Cargo-transport protein YPP1 n=1 Tax=Hanseniaspora valbyensis NRRL Y-1626 TaxID=766949 RepID=A0A1B7TEF5_9ASCO|nr:hypothetical protein HANVADRAFT_2225 [Hanseniaspora valbyensis NRRL Y-1626]